MTEEEIYDLYVGHIWALIPDYYQDEVDQCEKTILAGIKTIVDRAYERGKADAMKPGAGDLITCQPVYYAAPPAITCPKCGDGGMLGIAQDATVCGTCGYSWRESFPL